MVAQRCTFSVGETIDGKYTILRKIGEGTFGIVYQVRDNSQRDFALKILKSWEMIPEERQKQCERFKMEFETGRIDSPYLVHSYAIGYVLGNPYFVMDYCPNGDLEHMASQVDLINAFKCVLLGLKALHRNGKVHRDLKPSNVLIKSDGNVALTDFGISGDRNKRMTERNIFGKPIQIFGTFAYMPPEQINPQRDATVLPTTDIFSFGVMAYELLTQKLPFGILRSDSDLAQYIQNCRLGNWDKQALKCNSDFFLSMIEGCLQADYKQRLQTIDAVLCLLPGSAAQSVDNIKLSSAIGNVALRVMQGEEYGKIYRLVGSLLTLGRASIDVKNNISICELHSSYISRRHCTMMCGEDKLWKIVDGQLLNNVWKRSVNGTFVNSSEVSTLGYYLNIGDIISVGDVKLRVESY